MILVDSSVWIEYLRGTDVMEVTILDRALNDERVAIGDLVYVEVMRGVPERDGPRVSRRLLACEFRALGGRGMIETAVRHNSALRRRGITVRKTIDIVIATYCLSHGLRLLHRDRDFDPFEVHLGLQIYRG